MNGMLALAPSGRIFPVFQAGSYTFCFLFKIKIFFFWLGERPVDSGYQAGSQLMPEILDEGITLKGFLHHRQVGEGLGGT